MTTEQYDLARRGSRVSDLRASANDNPANTVLTALRDLNLRVAGSKLVDITDIETPFGDVEMTIRTSNRQQPQRQYKDSPLILRRRVTYHGQPKSTQLEINSKPLRSFLRKTLDGYPLLNLDSKVLVFPKPFEPLFYNASAIDDYIHMLTTNEQSPVETKSEVESTPIQPLNENGNVILPSPEPHRADQIELETDNAFQANMGHFLAFQSFMDININPTRSEYRSLVEDQRVANFEILWTLFEPGARVIEQNDYYIQAYLVDSSFLTEQNGIGIQVVDCVSWDYDGTYYGPKRKRFHIDSFPGTKRVSALPLYPIRFHNEIGHLSESQLLEALVSRGIKWRSLLKNAYRHYHSTAWIFRDPLEGKFTEKAIAPSYVSGPIILDYETHRQENPSQATALTFSNAAKGYGHALRYFYEGGFQYEDTTEGRNSQNSQNAEEEDLTSPAVVRGFALTEQAWGFFLVEHVQDWGHSFGNSDMLVLRRDVKSLILDMISSHNPKIDIDFMSGKGRGLIFLLQGPPGCGKTLTAEAMAALTGRPLYTLTGGFLGMDADKVNRELRLAFERAKAWNAIVLIDEADVYLASRDKLDLQRTLLVSVFLHRLEYFEGILFLTTNKAKVIDVAFESRITLMIPYPRLRSEQLSNVMRGLIISAAKNDPNLLVDRVVLENMDEYLRDDRASWINGRALKNLVKSAISLTSAQQEIETTDGKIYLGWNVFLMLIRQAEANRDQQKEIIRPLRRIRRTEEEQSGEWESTEPAKIHREHIPRQTLGEDEVDALDSATRKSREALSQAMNRDP
ncbi:P-loop containing nucleoside triphosphate hydrolase protein [Hyaloscypha variabilis F]|uniref:P-loop containing nucleoside triphosphate hydrolase protein n=1 Tax=Hyaloscypha variabilis (strain UAMH 11265 / GT02V1 / F) TaxID=1149755 RepID=A0A2J6RT98_HYAVF|nr:P-loop containing nucleoside triphosphate hydrolase protein [Hyaloscypha variabilis F]